MSSSDTLKAEGTCALVEGRNYEAVSKYSEALKLVEQEDDNNSRKKAILLSNRSLVWSRIGKREKAIADADLAIKEDKTYVKAWYRKAKALLEFAAFEEALQILEQVQAHNLSPEEMEEMIKLEKIIAEKKKLALTQPSIFHFEFIREIGTGNYSTIMEVKRKSDQSLYALKLIHKAQIEKVERRHPNVHNEILMEKRVLNKLKGHPNIIYLFATFQDADTLYYQMELIQGGELWAQLEDKKTGRMIPLAPSISKFYIREILRALEHCHKHNIVHRDCKPENVMIDHQSGRLKLVDFGTCKDLKDTDLNGPEFVGTPDYMAPEMVASKPPADYTADLWALGVITFQLLVGTTPFSARSPYFTFLKIKRANLRIPQHVHDDAVDFISNLLIKEPRAARLGGDADYSKLYQHPFLSSLHKEEIIRIPSLKDLCLKAATRYAQNLCNEYASFIPEHLRNTFAPSRFQKNPKDRLWIYHYLQKIGEIHHNAKLLRLFFDSTLDARSLRADPNTRIYLGHSRDDHGTFVDPFTVVILAAPAINQNDDANLAQLRRAVSAINRLRPPAVLCIGTLAINDEAYSLFRKTMARISESIPVVYCPGPHDNFHKYRQHFGANYYAFWFKGVRFIVLDLDHLDQDQQQFIDEEFEINALGSHRVFLITHTPPLWHVPTQADTLDKQQKISWAKHLLKARVDAILSASTTENKITKISRSHVRPFITKAKYQTPPCSDSDSDTSSSNKNKGDGIPEEEEDSDSEHNDINTDAQFSIISTSPLPGGIGEEERFPAGLRLLTIYEQTFSHTFHTLELVPTHL
mmetsp:Transcript_7306/g.10893  ORF Transcript_7306/g.10893 Transcript_7306/m.10893 type:complete len:808 (+) Transcript_7306:100-2523(+)